MKTRTFVYRSRIPASAREVYRWHTEPGALQRLVPPWERVEVVEEGALENGSLIILRVGLGPLRLRWISRIGNVIPGRQFRDVQIRGPFALWEHTHRMVPDGDAACWLEDWILCPAVRSPGPALRRPARAPQAGPHVRVPPPADPGTLFRSRVSYSTTALLLRGRGSLGR
jgi:ligand-binding SRPBCC domain-containing protein